MPKSGRIKSDCEANMLSVLGVSWHMLRLGWSRVEFMLQPSLAILSPAYPDSHQPQNSRHDTFSTVRLSNFLPPSFRSPPAGPQVFIVPEFPLRVYKQMHSSSWQVVSLLLFRASIRFSLLGLFQNISDDPRASALAICHQNFLHCWIFSWW